MVNSPVHGWIWPNFRLVRDFVIVLVICRNEEDSTQNEGARVSTTLYTDFADPQGQVTQQSVVGSG